MQDSLQTRWFLLSRLRPPERVRQLGLDHYEGRSWLGWYHHTALVTAAHGFLTLERLHLF